MDVLKLTGTSIRRRTLLRHSFGQAALIAVGASLFRCGGDSDLGSPGVGGAGGGVGSGVGSGTGSGVGSGTGSGTGSGVGGAGGAAPALSNIGNLGPLGDADANGVRLPQGFQSRIVAESGKPAAGSSYLWHGAPDGGVVFPTSDGGWIYVSNCERSGGQGGVGALKFSPTGELIDAYPILSGTSRNCAGGPTPWNTWLSCEEFSGGRVWECDPFGVESAQVLPALGVFQHEAVAVDPIEKKLYLTEDESDGRLYRFTPSSYPDLSQGTLEVLRVVDDVQGTTEWLAVSDPSGASTPTRDQVPTSTPFKGGEGIWYHDGKVFFTTKGDNRVWAYEVATGLLTILYDISTSSTPILSGVDNVIVSPGGDVLVAEDGGDLEIVAITPDGAVLPIVQLVGHGSSEIAGPAFDPSLQRLYFSSQRGTSGSSGGGITFEVSGPFFSAR